ncbi:origin recognition complex subunit 5 [Condylostylus longicornis]|uniref:origin recognition complex subunit 5 n=1 Tax=Condylostylus longicornis TaxID=2530218 RepID=UPI00244E0663|nr:origin recognition complex subunit 5 [Condylostylus longicornis]
MVDRVVKAFPCRNKIINELFNLIGNPNESYPEALFLYGDSSTGKTSILKKFLSNSGSKYILVDSIGCYTTKILFESILNGLKYNDNERNVFYDKCDNMQEFIWELKNLKGIFSYIICIDNSHRLRDMEINILPAFFRLRELTGLNICCIFLSQIPLEKYFLKIGLPEIIKIHFAQYSKTEIQKILLNDFVSVKAYVGHRLSRNMQFDKKLLKDFFEIMDESFYNDYLNIFLSVFYRSCRDLTELKYVSRNVFEIYCTPILKGEIRTDDVSKLWRYISNPLKKALAVVYTRTETLVDGCELLPENSELENVKSLELPFYAKYLLIAAFLASYNAAKEDKKLFVKNSERKKKRLQTLNANAKVTDKMSTILGPKSFSIDRLLAIFYAILDEKVGLTCNLLTQISTLVQLKFLTYVSGENNIMDGSARLQCIVSLDFIFYIGKMVGFNVKQYLSDFM